MVNIIISIVLSIVGYVVLLLLSTNLVGMVVRGFFPNPQLQEIKSRKNLGVVPKNKIKKMDIADVLITIVSIVVLAVFLYLLYRYLNIWAMGAAVVMMIARIPDLLREIKNKQVILPKYMKKDLTFYITTIMSWLPLPMLWWAIYLVLS